MRASVKVLIVAMLSTGLLAAERPASGPLTPEFKRQLKKDYLRQERDAAKAYRKSMKRRESPSCAPATRWTAPPEPYVVGSPGFPTMAMKSARCTVRFNLTKGAIPVDIDTLCTDPVYVPTVQQYVANLWFTSLKSEARSAGGLCGFETQLTFDLSELGGGPVPEPPKFPTDH